MAGMVGRLRRPSLREAVGHADTLLDGLTDPPAWPEAVSGRRGKGVPTGMRLLRHASWTPVLTIASVFGPMTVDARRVAPTAQPAASLPLAAMNYSEAERVGAVGSGCTWRDGNGRKSRLWMADDRAAVRRNGMVVALRPAEDAKAIFLTYDHWIGDGMRILVRDTGKVLARGRESSETVAWLDLVMDGRAWSFRGRLNCGS